MGWGDSGAERAGWKFADFVEVINAAARTSGNLTLAVEFDVRRQVVWKVDGFAVGFVLFQSKLICSGINLTHIVDAGVAIQPWPLW